MCSTLTTFESNQLFVLVKPINLQVVPLVNLEKGEILRGIKD